jgi:hypothetical protein
MHSQSNWKFFKQLFLTGLTLGLGSLAAAGLAKAVPMAFQYISTKRKTPPPQEGNPDGATGDEAPKEDDGLPKLTDD